MADYTDFYVRLDYRQYKHLEEQLANFKALETAHTSVDGFYHKAFRLEIGHVTFEFQGPAVKEPIHETIGDVHDGADRIARA